MALLRSVSIDLSPSNSPTRSDTLFVTNYLQQPLPRGSRTGAGFEYGQSGALGRGQRVSTGISTFNTFWVYVLPLFGAYIADTYVSLSKIHNLIS